MAQVSVALTAESFRAAHEQAVVLLGGDVFGRRRRSKTRPAGAGIELLIAAEQRGAAAGAAIHSFFVMIPVFARERAFRALLARDGELLRSQLLLPLRVGLFDLIHFDDLPSTSIIPEEDEFLPRTRAGKARIGQRPRLSRIDRGDETCQRE